MKPRSRNVRWPPSWTMRSFIFNETLFKNAIFPNNVSCKLHKTYVAEGHMDTFPNCGFIYVA